jgi:hypothetical protein
MPFAALRYWGFYFPLTWVKRLELSCLLSSWRSAPLSSQGPAPYSWDRSLTTPTYLSGPFWCLRIHLAFLLVYFHRSVPLKHPRSSLFGALRHFYFPDRVKFSSWARLWSPGPPRYSSQIVQPSTTAFSLALCNGWHLIGPRRSGRI